MKKHPIFYLILGIIILLVLILLCFFLAKHKVKVAYLEKIDLNLEQDEIGLVLYDNYILEINDDNKLYILDGKININKIKNIFNLDNLNKKDNFQNLKLAYYDYHFCFVSNNDINTEDCTFIYVKNNSNLIKLVNIGMRLTK